MTWTTPADLRGQVRRLWDRGLLLEPLAGGPSSFPRRLTLKGPSSTELAERFDAARTWIADLRQQPHVRIEWREVRHRVLGSNQVPAEVWLDTLDDALALVCKTREARRFAVLAEQARRLQPALLPWLAVHPLKGLELADDWSLLLEVVGWVQAHPRPGCYLRQIDLPNVHTKFIEAHRGVLAALLDLALPADAIDPEATGAAQFCRRYGFADKPVRIRFRPLDPRLGLIDPGLGPLDLALHPLDSDVPPLDLARLPLDSGGKPVLPPTDGDLTVSLPTFARLDLKVSKVYITENEINFLAFPPVPDGLVVFGAGYGLDALAQAPWLRRCQIHYWGDLDTHGFAILDELRASFPAARSFLMDRGTLLAHRSLWVTEPQPHRRDLSRLDPHEREVYDDLREDRLGKAVRLEQERIGYDSLLAALGRL